MRACVQRVTRAHVTVADETTGRIEHGLVVLLGVGQDDTDQDVKIIAERSTQTC